MLQNCAKLCMVKEQTRFGSDAFAFPLSHMEGLLEGQRSPDKLRIRSTVTSLLWLDRLDLPLNTEALLHLFVLSFSAVAAKQTSPWN